MKVDYKKVTNAIEAEFITNEAAIDFFNVRNFGLRKIKAIKLNKLNEEESCQKKLLEIYKKNASNWKKIFFKENFSQFLKCHLGKKLMGVENYEPKFYNTYTTSEF